LTGANGCNIVHEGHNKHLRSACDCQIFMWMCEGSTCSERGTMRGTGSGSFLVAGMRERWAKQLRE
jgi:hypothetical protein